MDTLKFTAVTLLVCTCLVSGVTAQRRRVSGAQSGGVDFDCPDEFGYYPHPTDCTQYYVCVFGGALLESCTGGLMYSHELQTCDWPRNVGCGESGGGASVSTVRVTDSRTGSGNSAWRGATASTPSVTPARQSQRVQQQQQQPQQQQYPLYADELGPAEEAEAIDRQQRVYRGQPPTVGQVARDRDGLRLQHSAVTNSIPLVNSGRTTADKSSSSSYVTQQYRKEQGLQDDLLLTHNTLDDGGAAPTRTVRQLTNNVTLSSAPRRRRRKRATPRLITSSSREPRLANPRDFINPWPGSATHSTRQQQGPLQFRDLDDFFAFSNAYLQNPALAPRLPTPTPTPPGGGRITTAFRPNSSPFGLPQRPEVDVDTFLDRLRASKAIEAQRAQQDFFSLPNVKSPLESSAPLIDYEDYFSLPEPSRPPVPVNVGVRDEPSAGRPTPPSLHTLPPRTKLTQQTTAYTYEYEPVESTTRRQVQQIQNEQFAIDDFITQAPPPLKSTPSTKGFSYLTSLPSRGPPSPPRQLPLNENDFTKPTSRPSPIDEFLRATGVTPRGAFYITKSDPITTPRSAPTTIRSTTTTAPPTLAPTTRASTKTRSPSPTRARNLITRAPSINSVTKSTRQPLENVEDATRGPSTPAPSFAFPFGNDLSTQSLLPIEQYFTPTHTTPRPLKSETPGRFKASTQFLPSVDDIIDADKEYLQSYLSKLAASSPTTPRPFRVSSAVTPRSRIPALVEDIVLITPPPTNSRGRISTTALPPSSTTTTSTTTSTTTTSTTTTSTSRPTRPTSRTRPSSSTTQTTSARPVADDARQYKRPRPTSRARGTAATTAKRRPEPPQPTVQDYAPTSPPHRASQNYSQQYSSYPSFPAYDEDVGDIYRDVDYGSQYPSAAGGQQQQQQQQPQQTYRGQSPYKTAPTAAPPAAPQYNQQYDQQQYTQQPQDAYVQQDYSSYNTQQESVDYATPQPRQPSRGAPTQNPTSTSTFPSRSTTTTTTTQRPTTEQSTPASRRDRHRGRSYSNEAAIVATNTAVSEEEVTPPRSRNVALNRGSTRARLVVSSCDEDDVTSDCTGAQEIDNRVSESPATVSSRGRARPTPSSSFDSSTLASPTRITAAAPSRTRGSAAYTAVDTSNNNRGRSRPTLKPTSTIVSKASDYIDIYRYPPYRHDPVYPTPRVDQAAAKCRKDVCLLPDCFCGGKDIPGGYEPEQMPQLVLLTFDDSVNDLNKKLYESLFERGRRNPNGCPISATFYVSHEWTDYSQVQNLYADGHEMASHSISHSFGEQFSQKKWLREIAGQREILAAYGGVKLEDVRGMRAPFLAVGGNKMFKMLYDANFTYDSSMPIYENRPPSYPYTLDYKLFHDCMIPPCPTKSYPGVWEVPMVMWQDLNGGRCSMGDACSNPPTADGVYKMLIKNFERHYTTNRAPFGLYYHAAWFTHAHHKEGFEAFLDTIVAMDDVWLVTNWQAIQWMRDPQPLSTVKNFAPLGCDYPDRPKRCNNPRVCNLWHKSGVRYMRTCQPCPDIYPWTGKTGVRNSRVDNNEVDES